MYETLTMATSNQNRWPANVGPPSSCMLVRTELTNGSRDQPHPVPVTGRLPYCNMCDDDFDESFDEEVDEDFLEDEKEFYQDSKGCLGEEQTENVTEQLLKFADMVNGDIKKYFGRKKDDEDSCDIYEDKWSSGKSGRELYYAELLRIAQGIDTDPSKDKIKNTTSEKKYSGKLDKSAGLGPLDELFDVGLQKYTKPGKKVKRLKPDLHKNGVTMPMTKRNLPKSFWSEPGGNPDAVPNKSDNGLFTATPDLSDVLMSWTGGDATEMAISDVSSASPDSAIDSSG